jgi:hypothetical protein
MVQTHDRYDRNRHWADEFFRNQNQAELAGSWRFALGEPADCAGASMTDTYDSVAYQTTLVQTYANVKNVLKRRSLDPLRYIVEIDAGLPIFALRDAHQLRIAYNRFATLSVEASIPHQWMQEESGEEHDHFMRAVDELVLSLKSKVEATGRPV